MHLSLVSVLLIIRIELHVGHFYGSGSSFGSDHFSLIELVKSRYVCCHSALNVDVSEQENIFSAPTSGFGF